MSGVRSLLTVEKDLAMQPTISRPHYF